MWTEKIEIFELLILIFLFILFQRGSDCLCVPAINQSHATLRTNSLDEKTSLLVDVNRLRRFAESCTKIQLSQIICRISNVRASSYEPG